MKTMLLALLLALPAVAQDGKKPPRCVGCEKETYGTTIEWEGTPTEAGARAREEQKLLFILHVSGNFENPAFT